MEEIHEIVYDGKTYEVKQPTISQWQELIRNKDLKSERLFLAGLISQITGISEDELLEADYHSVMITSEALMKYFESEAVKFHPEFEFEGDRYKFVDLRNLTWGEFIDIDEYLSLPKQERERNYQLMMAMLYRKLDEKGNYTKYNAIEVKEIAEKFKNLPVKYLQGSTVFFWTIENILQKNIHYSFLTKAWWIVMMKRISRKIQTLSDGLVSLYKWPTRMFSRLTMWFKKTTLKYSTSSHGRKTKTIKQNKN